MKVPATIFSASADLSVVREVLAYLLAILNSDS